VHTTRDGRGAGTRHAALQVSLPASPGVVPAASQALQLAPKRGVTAATEAVALAASEESVTIAAKRCPLPAATGRLAEALAVEVEVAETVPAPTLATPPRVIASAPLPGKAVAPAVLALATPALVAAPTLAT